MLGGTPPGVKVSQVEQRRELLLLPLLPLPLLLLVLGSHRRTYTLTRI